MILRKQCIAVDPSRVTAGREEVARRLREAAALNGERLGEGRTWSEPHPHPGAIRYVYAEAPLLCRCHLPCAEVATREPGLCDTCSETSHAHVGPVGSPFGAPFAVVLGSLRVAHQDE